MSKLSDIIDFRRELYFDGAVQISWYETDEKRRDQAASNYVFHGPAYHGVSETDIDKADDFSLIDTASFSKEILDYFDSKSDKKSPLALSIAGYGTGKSHLGLTLATLLSDPANEISKTILQNIENADPSLCQEIRHKLQLWKYPSLILPVNGMEDFDLSSELTRQVLTQLKARNLDTAPIEELSPRFQIATTFVERNFDLRKKEFRQHFNTKATASYITQLLFNHDDDTYRKINEIYENANGYPIPVMGQESPKQLIQTLCENYCGEQGPFQNILILFDEFGRYLQFASEKPHIAGDAALQQLYEGVQDNAEKCFLLCFIQYELKAYISRVSHEKRSTINRFIGRYETGKKYYLSTNLETLFANLIQKKDSDFILEHLYSDTGRLECNNIHAGIQKWFPGSQIHAVWRDLQFFGKVIYHGCWPLHPAATWFISRLSTEGKELQQRSAISFIEDAYEKFKDVSVSESRIPWSISAVKLCSGALLEELIASEESGHRGAVAQSYMAAEQRYKEDFTEHERSALLSVLIASKISLKPESRQDAHEALAMIAGLNTDRIEKAIQELQTNYNVLEWNDRFNRYEIIGDAVSRGAFTSFLRNHVNKITTEKIEEIFALNIKNWGNIADVEPDFAAFNNIGTVEWGFQAECTTLAGLENKISNALQDWKNAFKTDKYRGQLIYCYNPPDADIYKTQNFIKSALKTVLAKGNYPEKVPILLILLNDYEAKLGKLLSEYWVLSNELTGEDELKFSNFIKNHNNRLIEDIRFTIEGMVQDRLYVYPDAFDLENIRLKKITYNLFEQTYPKIIPFPFDGFQTARGNAAKSCREITVELIKGTLNEDWISSAAPEVRNRSVTLLEEWGALGSDGKIAWIPSHSKVRELISDLDQKIKNEGNINLGEIIKTLVMPPYGFNIASSGLMIGIFLSPRKNNTVLIFQGEDIAPSVWAGKVFTGNFLNTKKLEETFVRHISDDESSEWAELLGKWDSEQTHSGRIDFMQQAEVLKERIPLPGERRDRWLRLNEEAEKSFVAVKAFENLIEDQDEYFFRACEKEEVKYISYAGVKLNYQSQKMLNEEHRWSPDQLNLIPPRIDKIKQAIIHFFDPWLKQQTILKSQQIGKYNHEMIEQTGKNFQILGLSDLFKKLERHVRKNIARINEVEKISFIVDEARAFLDSNKANSNSKISELNEWTKRCEELTENLLKAKKVQDVADIDKLLKRINKFTDDCKNIKELHKKQAGELWNLEFYTLENIRSARIKVKNLMGIYFGQDMDMDDLTMMDTQLGQFERDIILWNDSSIPNSDLKNMVAVRITEIIENHDEEDEPPWDSKTVYNNFLNHILKERHKESVKWMEGVEIAYGIIEKMSAEKCQTLLNRLDFKPAYLGDEQIQTILKMKTAIENRLDDLQVEGLLVRFRQLPAILQKEFMRIITSEENL